MNCQDIADMLDDCDTRKLDAPLQRKVAAHLTTCAACAMDWDVSMRLQQLSDLPMRASFAAACRAAVGDSVRPGSVRRVANRYLVGAALFAVAAAAAMLAIRWDRSAADQFAGPSAGTAQASSGDGVEVLADPVAAPATPASLATPATARSSDAGGATASSSTTWRIGVLPLANEGNDAAGQAAIEGFYDAILDGLRKRRDVQLSRIASREAAEGQVDFLIEVTGYTTEKGLRGMLRATRLGADPLTLPITGQFHASCATPVAAQTPQCLDGTVLASSMLDMLRSGLLPAAKAERDLLVARVGDAAATPDQRLTALRELAFPRATAPGPMPQRMERPADLADPVLLQGAIDLAAVGSPAQRAEVWRTLRDVGAPALIDPLIQSARLDVDAAVRMEAVATLGTRFSSDPRVRSELDIVATQDSRPLVRALAQRALSGEPAWRRYITAALKDESLPAAERLEPLFHHLNEGSEGLGEMFDEAAIRGFAAALAGARGTPLATRISTVVFSRAGEVESPAMTDLLLAAFSADDGSNRVMYLHQLVRRPRDARIDTLLREVAVSDPDLQVRQIATRALAQQPASPTAGR